MLTHLRQVLYGMGILYDHEENTTHDSEPNNIVCDIRVEQPPPMFVIRNSKPRRSRRRSSFRSLPLYLSFSSLSEDTEIAQFISSSTIQHRPISIPIPQTISTSPDIKIPLSLPSTPALQPPVSNSISLPTSPNHEVNDWILIPQHTCTTLITTTPSTNPEPWILIDDS